MAKGLKPYWNERSEMTSKYREIAEKCHWKICVEVHNDKNKDKTVFQLGVEIFEEYLKQVAREALEESSFSG